jgi:hypothetical protein
VHYPKLATARWRVGGVVLLVLAVTAIVVPQLGQAEATNTNRDAVGKYLGRWNYDQPDRDTMTNIATSNLPGIGGVPQIGDIVFTAEGPGRIVGRTDVGCTWRFKVTRDSLELDPSSQFCHNPTANLDYTISRWTVTVEGVYETETIIATSHYPHGNYDFVLEKGARTKAREYDPGATTKFTGTWTDDTADSATGVTITRDYTNRITARTGNGCTWSLVARGNTAKLDPPIQTCPLPTSAVITIRFWTIATDGRQQAYLMTGTDERGNSFTRRGSLTEN